MPIGPTGRIRAIGLPASRARLMVMAISWPIMISKSVVDSQTIGSNWGCHQGRRSSIDSGGWAQQASIFARSQPAGRNPSIIEPE